MKLRTNSKQAMENVMKYIIVNCDGSSYGLDFSKMTVGEVFKHIIDIFRDEHQTPYWQRKSEQTGFIDWCADLPSVIDTCYYYNRSAVDDLGNILQETDEEKAQYTEQEAEWLLSYLIYRCLIKYMKKF